MASMLRTGDSLVPAQADMLASNICSPRVRRRATQLRRPGHAARATSRSAWSTSRPPGRSAERDTITEIGAVKVRGGEVLGTFHTLVNPGRAIPPEITVLTGITQAMVDARAAGRGGAAGVRRVRGGHGAGRPQRALRRRLPRTRRSSATAGPAWRHPLVDTAALARRLRARRGAQLPAGHARQPLAARPPAHPSSARRRAGHDRPPPPPARAGRELRRARPRRPARPCPAWRPTRRPPSCGSRRNSPAAPGVYLFVGAAGRGALRRQGGQPAPAGALVLLHRRAPEGARPAPRSHRHPPHAVQLHPGSGRHRDPPHPRAPAPLQPPGAARGRPTTTSSSRWARPSRGSPSCGRPRTTARSTSARCRRPPPPGWWPTPSTRSCPCAAARCRPRPGRRFRSGTRRARRPSSGWPRARAPGQVDRASYDRRRGRGRSRASPHEPAALLDPLRDRMADAGRGRALRGGGRRARPRRRPGRRAGPPAPARRAAAGLAPCGSPSPAGPAPRSTMACCRRAGRARRAPAAHPPPAPQPAMARERPAARPHGAAHLRSPPPPPRSSRGSPSARLPHRPGRRCRTSWPTKWPPSRLAGSRGRPGCASSTATASWLPPPPACRRSLLAGSLVAHG